MWERLRVALVFLLLLGVGAILGSTLAEWRRHRAGPGAPPEAGDSTARPIHRIRVEVLNAAGRDGMARRATDYLRELGFDVVYFGNAESFGRDTSIVLDRVRRLPDARRVADALGVRRVVSRPDSNLYLDVSVLLGADWRVPERPPEERVPAERPWWHAGRVADELQRLWEDLIGSDDAGSSEPRPGWMVDPSP